MTDQQHVVLEWLAAQAGSSIPREARFLLVAGITQAIWRWWRLDPASVPEQARPKGEPPRWVQGFVNPQLAQAPGAADLCPHLRLQRDLQGSLICADCHAIIEHGGMPG